MIGGVYASEQNAPIQGYQILDCSLPACCRKPSLGEVR